ncbi:hypothetical protein [Calycomorphotria hydatis]|uniref:Uncharacterized protein n=1 Tax=Calycomorphotria hydatis TaxID=2528027 RepID=A0A517T4M1_9PLAN|nr:hypothetical protein [Calycomorphotria hydatis]QDT63336.1 hypothetical protein V22_05570 [Calycomorphotria hydatis]
MWKNNDNDIRMYVPNADDWRVQVKADFSKQYCHAKKPDEEYYHLLIGGEIYLDNGEKKLCLNCAIRDGIITWDRQHWEKGGR